MMFVTSFQFPSSICPSNTNEEEGSRTRQSSVYGPSRIEKVQRRAQRRKNISAEDLKREVIADRLKCPLIFMAPVMLILLLLFVLFGIYILKPFYKVLNFTAGNCTVLEIGMKPQGSCSSDGDRFSPCVQIKINTSFPCFYNPAKPHEVIRKKQLTWGIAVNSILWPFLCLLGYGAAGGFVLFDCNKRRKLNALLEEQNAKSEREKTPIEIRRRRSKIACRHGNQHISHFSNYPTMINGSLSCTCLDHVLEDQTTSTPRAEASQSHPSTVFWTEQDLLNLEHMDLAVTEYTQRRPPSTYSNVFVPQEGEEVVDSETEWNALCENMDFGISEQEIEHYFNSISRRHHFRQNILPFRPFTVMNETRV
ncbi:uncharacterized protein [Hemitrygon akajei]|uniref:uncharacterized protein isoform X2 n=1 Tax=Hemitrygon akajei TaxID=2704970 RepID=UPI003BF9C2EB